MAGNPDIEPRLLELIGRVPFWETIGIELEDAEVGRVRLRLAMREDLRTFGDRRVLHGGAIATLIDSAAASATRTLRGEDEPPWRGLATTDMHVSYLAAVTGGEVTAEGRVLRAGGGSRSSMSRCATRTVTSSPVGRPRCRSAGRSRQARGRAGAWPSNDRARWR